MRRMDPSEYDGFEKKPEAEWTERDRELLAAYGVIPLTEAGEKAFLKHLSETDPVVKATEAMFDELDKAKTTDERIEIMRRRLKEAKGEASGTSKE